MWLLRHRDLFFEKRFAGLPSSLCFLGLGGDLTFSSGTWRSWPEQRTSPLLTGIPRALYRLLPKDELTVQHALMS